MAIGCGPKVAKLLLIVFNILFWLSGLLLIVVAAIYMSNGTIKYVDEVIDASTNKNILIGFLAIGIIIFVIGFCGCCGAIKESRMCLAIYIVLVLMIIIAEVAFGVYAIVQRQEVETTVTTKLSKSMKELYGNDTTVNTTVDGIQQLLKCCGVESYHDWKTSKWYESAKDKNQVVPYSCCSVITIPCWNSSDSTIFQTGCVPTIQAYCQKYFPAVIGVALGIAFFEIFVVICAFCLCHNTGTQSQSV